MKQRKWKPTTPMMGTDIFKVADARAKHDN